MTGKFIIIEGTDGSGKTTQLNLLNKWLEEAGIRTHTIDFPQYDEFWGRMVGRYLRGEFGELEEVNPYLVSVLFMLDQAKLNRKISKWIKEDYYVLSNRYVTSSMAHQTSKFASDRQQRQYLEWINKAAYKELGLIKEDLTIVLYADTEILKDLSVKARMRKSKYTITKDIAEDHGEHQKNSAEIYVKLCTEIETWELVNCMNEENRLKSVEEVHKMVLEKVKECLGLDPSLNGANIDLKHQLKLV